MLFGVIRFSSLLYTRRGKSHSEWEERDLGSGGRISGNNS
jgi:hypothetical protein